MSPPLELLLLGLALGVRHATDADHVVAVSAIASRERSVPRAVLIGVSWGLGHALSVLCAGGAIVLLGIVVPPRLGLGLELSVGVILVALGLANLLGASKQHSHAGAPNVAGSVVGLFKPLGVGVAHGLAGSAAVALLVLASIHDARSALYYLAVFGFGTLLGMVGLTSALAFPVAYAARRFERAHWALSRVAGLLSVAFGLLLVYRIGFIDGFFTSAPQFHPE
ncbi:MAG TPA: high-affinity nickel-transport family protein [Polyangiaceae bacterium]|nr:high-affinity nickel-transport family protein [Polyangiaceae bacterium]